MRKKKAVSREIRTLPETRAVLPQRKIRMQLLRESLRLSFLIAWIRMSSVWHRQFRRTSRNSSCRRYNLTVRERRMLKRIELLRSAADEENKLAAGETGMTAVGNKKGLEKGQGDGPF